MKKYYFSVLILMLAAAPAFATVNVSSPSNDETVSPSVQFVASATTSCSKGISSMGVYVDDDRKYVASGANINTWITLSAGAHKTVIEEWDGCGGASTAVRTVTVKNENGVSVTSPAPGATVSSPANFLATATTSCSKGVSSMGIYVNGKRVYVVGGAKLNTQIPLGSGPQNTVVEEWDGCGGAVAKSIPVNVAGDSTGKVLSALQGASGWDQWGELPPTDATCNAPCGGKVNFSMGQHEGAVSRSGNGTKFTIGGNTPYADALFSNPIMGQRSTLIPDGDQKLIPTLHNFTYDTWVYVGNASVTQSLEFDINMYLNSKGLEWGTQCNHLGDGSWNI